MQALAQIDEWPVDNAAAVIVSPQGVAGAHGDGARAFRWASVTKVFTAAAVLVAAEEGILDLDEPAGPKGSTVLHLLAHASGLPFEGTVPIGRPGERRIYSNAGFDALGDLVAARAEMPFADYLRGAVLEPLGLAGTELHGRPSEGLRGPVDDLARFGQELFSPSFVAAETLAEATTVAFPGLNGIVPGIGRYEPNDWGLGFELKNGKEPHWTGSANSARTFGHFGGAGAFLWVDPEAGVALACLSDRQFGDWALEAWPLLSDAVLAGRPGV